MTLSAVASRQPWERETVSNGRYNQRLSIQQSSTGNFTEEDAELIEAATQHIETLVKDNLRKEIVATRLIALVWMFLENQPPEPLTPMQRHIYETAENALMDLGLHNKEPA